MAVILPDCLKDLAAADYSKAAAALGITKMTLRKMIRDGILKPVYLTPRKPVIPIWQIENLLCPDPEKEQ